MTIAETLIPPTIEDVYAAREVVRMHLKPTPVLKPPSLTHELGFEVVLKCENLQPLGAFKMRGGIYYMSLLDEEERARGVVTSSSGNHAQSVVNGARLFGVRAVIFMPENPNPAKAGAVQRLGGEIIEFRGNTVEMLEAAERYAEEHGMRFIHPIDNPTLYAGVGTYALELIEEEPDLDAVFVPVGGGSGVCGTATVYKALSPETKVIAAQTEQKPAVFESYHQKRIVSFLGEETWAEGLAVETAYELPFGMMQELVDDVKIVSEEDMRQAVISLLEHAHVLVEASGTAGFAAARNMADDLQGKRVGIVLSGGNMTMETLAKVLTDPQPW